MKATKPTYSEAVLPDGSFARVRAPLVRDMAAFFGTDDPMQRMCKVSELLVTIDGNPVTYQQFWDMEYINAAPVFQRVSTSILEAIKTMNGVA